MEEKYSSKLHNVMLLNGWRQKDVAEELGTSEAHVSRLLNGANEPSKPLAKLIDFLVKESTPTYAVSKVHEGLSPDEYEAVRIIRECPEALSVVRMMGAVDSDTQKDILRSAEKEKLLQDMIKERLNKETA